MSLGRRSASAKRGLLAGAALMVFCGAAQAQEAARAAPASPDGLAPGQHRVPAGEIHLIAPVHNGQRALGHFTPGRFDDAGKGMVHRRCQHHMIARV